MLSVKAQKDSNGNVVGIEGTFEAAAKLFSTKSEGFFEGGKYSIEGIDGKLYQVTMNFVEIGSKYRNASK